MPSTSLFKSGPIAGKSVFHGPTFAGEQWISTGACAFLCSQILLQNNFILLLVGLRIR